VGAAVSAAPAGGPIQLVGLSANARATLPNATLIQLKPGLVVSLGALRNDHRERMERFAAAANLGAQANARLKSETELHLKRGSHHPALTLLAIPATAYDAVPWTGVPGSRWAPDYTAFCKAAKASICLYVPKSNNGIGSSLEPAAEATISFSDIDWLITDKTICSEEDGTLYIPPNGVVLGCLFFYPSGFNVQYYAGNPPSATASTNCPSPSFTKAIDPHGGAQASWNYNYSYSGIPWGGSSSKTITCTIAIMVPSGQPKPAPTPQL
jgi:hypothetical protein